MIENGTRVTVDMPNGCAKSLRTLLNSLGGEVVKEVDLGTGTIGYLIAYDLEHLDAISAARSRDSTKYEIPMISNILGINRSDEFPGDERYYLLAFEDEVKAA